MSNKELPEPKKKVSKLAISALILGLFTPFTLLLTYLPAIILGIISLVRIHRYKLKGAKLAVSGIIISVVTFIIFAVSWCRDMPPIEYDYTIADLRSAPVECNESYNILLELIEYEIEEVPFNEISEKEENSYIPLRHKTRSRKVCVGLGMDGEDADVLENLTEQLFEAQKTTDKINIIVNSKADIERLWSKSKKGRSLLRQLDEYTEIADLAQPKSLDERDSILISNLRCLQTIYHTYCLLQCEQGSCSSAVDELLFFDAVTYKLSLNARELLNSFICLGIQTGNISAASLIATHPKCTDDVLKKLKNYYKQERAYSLRNGVLFDYLCQKATVEKLIQPKIPLLLKKNSTFLYFRNYADIGLKNLAGDNIPNNEPYKICRLIPIRYLSPLDEESFSEIIYSIYNPIGYYSGLILFSTYDRKVRDKIVGTKDIVTCLLNDDLTNTSTRRFVLYEDKSLLYVDYSQSDHEITCRCVDCSRSRYSIPVCDRWIAENKNMIATKQ